MLFPIQIWIQEDTKHLIEWTRSIISELIFSCWSLVIIFCCRILYNVFLDINRWFMTFETFVNFDQLMFISLVKMLKLLPVYKQDCIIGDIKGCEVSDTVDRSFMDNKTSKGSLNWSLWNSTGNSEFILFDRSFIYNKSTKRPRTEPCGTLYVIRSLFYLTELYVTNCFLF